jgi:hypothetical protein
MRAGQGRRLAGPCHQLRTLVPVLVGKPWIELISILREKMMRHVKIALAAAVAVGGSLSIAGGANAAVMDTGMRAALDGLAAVEHVQYRYGGHRYSGTTTAGMAAAGTGADMARVTDMAGAARRDGAAGGIASRSCVCGEAKAPVPRANEWLTPLRQTAEPIAVTCCRICESVLRSFSVLRQPPALAGGCLSWQMAKPLHATSTEVDFDPTIKIPCRFRTAESDRGPAGR